MEIRELLLKFKFHILSAAALAALIVFICYVAPSFLDILKYFWPLLVSTALFLVAVLVFDRISMPSSDSPAEKAGEGLLEYVAGDLPIGVVESVQSDATVS